MRFFEPQKKNHSLIFSKYQTFNSSRHPFQWTSFINDSQSRKKKLFSWKFHKKKYFPSQELKKMWRDGNEVVKKLLCFYESDNNEYVMAAAIIRVIWNFNLLHFYDDCFIYFIYHFHKSTKAWFYSMFAYRIQ